MRTNQSVRTHRSSTVTPRSGPKISGRGRNDYRACRRPPVGKIFRRANPRHRTSPESLANCLRPAITLLRRQDLNLRPLDPQSGLTCFRLFQDATKVPLSCRISLNPSQAESPHPPLVVTTS